MLQPVLPLQALRGVWGVVDGTHCPTWAPLGLERGFRAGPVHTVKYLVVTRLCDGVVIFVSSWYPGSMHDITVLRLCGVLDMLLAGELPLADLGFIGEHQCLTKVKRVRGQQHLSAGQQWSNYILESFRAIVERTLGRITTFNYLRHAWRHDHSLHDLVFRLICQLINLDLVNHPLTRQDFSHPRKYESDVYNLLLILHYYVGRIR